VVNLEDTRAIETDELWLAPPLAVPFVLKGMLFEKFQFSL
jgi:hypothetical protein